MRVAMETMRVEMEAMGAMIRDEMNKTKSEDCVKDKTKSEDCVKDKTKSEDCVKDKTKSEDCVKDKTKVKTV